MVVLLHRPNAFECNGPTHMITFAHQLHDRRFVNTAQG